MLLNSMFKGMNENIDVTSLHNDTMISCPKDTYLRRQSLFFELSCIEFAIYHFIPSKIFNFSLFF